MHLFNSNFNSLSKRICEIQRSHFILFNFFAKKCGFKELDIPQAASVNIEFKYDTDNVHAKYNIYYKKLSHILQLLPYEQNYDMLKLLPCQDKSGRSVIIVAKLLHCHGASQTNKNIKVKAWEKSHIIPS